MSQYMGCNYVEIMLDNHECYTSKESVLEEIRNNEKIIEQHKDKLFGMVCGRIHDLFCDKDIEGNDIDPVDKAINEFNRLFDEEQYGISYLVAHNVLLQQLYDNWDKRWSEFDNYEYKPKEDK